MIIGSQLEYANLAKRTLKRLETKELDLLHMQVGVATEVGEILDSYKRWFAYGKQLDWVNVSEEWADVAWYLICRKVILGATITSRSIASLRGFVVYTENRYEHIKAIQEFHLGHMNNPGAYDLRKWIEIGYMMGIDVQDALLKNIKKLAIRYPDKYSDQSALLRDLSAERVVLEGNQLTWTKRFGRFCSSLLSTTQKG